MSLPIAQIASQMSLEVSELCSSKQIVLVALYPNATHILQPLDVHGDVLLRNGALKMVAESYHP